MTEKIQLVTSKIENNIKPFTDALVANDSAEIATQIIGLIRAIETDPEYNCITLYNLLQFYLDDAADTYGRDAADSLEELYTLMSMVYEGLLRKNGVIQ